MVLPKGYISGRGGASVADIRAYLLPGALASAAKILILRAGINSINAGVRPATVASEYADICNQWVASASDRVVLGWDEVPTRAAPFPAAQAELREALRRLHDPARGIYILPSWAAAAAAPDGSAEKTGYYRDGLHWSIVGGWSQGHVLARGFGLVAPPAAGEATARPGALDPGQWSLTATGEFQPGGAGVVGWTLPTVSGVRYTTEIADGHTWLVVAAHDVTDLDLAIYPEASTTPTGITAGTTLDSNILYKRQGVSNVVQLSLQMRNQSGAILSDAQGRPAGDQIPLGPMFHASNGSVPDTTEAELLWVDDAVYDGTSTGWRPWWITIQGLPTSARPGARASGVFKFALPQERIGGPQPR
jgi:hypothetical protein